NRARKKRTPERAPKWELESAGRTDWSELQAKQCKSTQRREIGIAPIIVRVSVRICNRERIKGLQRVVALDQRYQRAAEHKSLAYDPVRRHHREEPFGQLFAPGGRQAVLINRFGFG